VVYYSYRYMVTNFIRFIYLTSTKKYNIICIVDIFVKRGSLYLKYNNLTHILS